MQQSSFSQLKLSVIQAKDSSSMLSDIACESIVNACQEYEELGGLATAKLKRKEERLELAHPPVSETGANSLTIHAGWLLKSGASRQEKASRCNGNGAATDEYLGDFVVDQFR